ncbi:MAG: amidohydrolase [Salibacteraceae bacterium]
MRIVLIFISLLTMSTSCLQTTPVDLLVRNAKIHSMDEENTTYQAMAIKDGKVVEMGAEYEILNKYTAEETFDARTKTIYPGFIDAHCHFYGYGTNLTRANLLGTTSYEEVLERIANYPKEFPNQPWVLGRGWDQNDWEVKEFPDRAPLDELFPNIPVMLHRIDGHAILVNGKALEMAGVTPETEVSGGEIVVKDGRVTGVLIDGAMDLVRSIVPAPTKEQMTQALLHAQEKCLAVGLTTVSDAGLNKAEVELIEELHESGKLQMRVYAMLSDTEENLDHYVDRGPYQTDRLTVKAFKFYADGALGSRGACMCFPYSDAPDHHGFILRDRQYYSQMADLMKLSGFQMNTHCIGDSANRMMLDIYGAVLKNETDRRWRIEHAQVVTPEDIPRFGEYRVIPSVQPTHATSDMYWAEERLGPDRIKTAYAYQELLAQNKFLPLGTDFPVEDINPMLTFYAAVARQDLKGFPEGGFQSENALTREQALRGMTIWAALANFEEQQKGSLEVGKVADFVVLNVDLLKAPLKAIPEAKVAATFINGQQVY